MSLRRKDKYMVRFLFGILIDTWPRKMRGDKLKTAINWCRNNPKWERYWEYVRSHD